MHDDRWRGAGLAALSLTGGAALTILCAGTAGAGDAEAVGNTSDTSGNQTLVVTPGADPTVADLDGTVVNGGAATANTGVNGGEEAEVTTGHAHASGNESQTQLDQSARSSSNGAGLTVIDQGATVVNLGAAVANTGFNDGAAIDTGDATAWGNRSWTSVVQRAVLEDTSAAARFVSQAATVDNLGTAQAETGRNTGGDITTGNASAGGNDATTTASQAARLTGDQVGAAVVEQLARTRNRGQGVANTGFNEATGDDSTNVPED